MLECLFGMCMKRHILSAVLPGAWQGNDKEKQSYLGKSKEVLTDLPGKNADPSTGFLLPGHTEDRKDRKQKL